MRRTLPVLFAPLLGCSSAHLHLVDANPAADAPTRVDVQRVDVDARPDAGPRGGCRAPDEWVASSSTTLDTYVDSRDDFLTPVRPPIHLSADASGGMTAVWGEGDHGAIHTLHARQLDPDGRLLGLPRRVPLDTPMAGTFPTVARTLSGFASVYCAWRESEGAMQGLALSVDSDWNVTGQRPISTLGSCGPFALEDSVAEPSLYSLNGSTGATRLAGRSSWAAPVEHDYGRVPGAGEGSHARSLSALHHGGRTLVTGAVDVFAGRRQYSIPFAMVRDAEGVAGPVRALATEADGLILESGFGSRKAMAAVPHGNGFRVFMLDASQTLHHVELDEGGAVRSRGVVSVERVGAFAALEVGADSVGIEVREAGDLRLFTLDFAGERVTELDLPTADERGAAASSPVVLATGETSFAMLYEAVVARDEEASMTTYEVRLRSFRCAR